MKPPTTFLIDTGPLVAYLDRADSHHAEVRHVWDQLSGVFLTTAAVITETLHFLRDVPQAPQLIAEGLQAGYLTIEETFHPADIAQAALLMQKYHDTPMDFADATLVVLASRLNVGHILTLDQRGFRTYRYARAKAFRLVIQDSE